MRRRFGLVFEFDRRGGIPGGTPEQQAFIREVVATKLAVFGSLFYHEVLYPLTVAIKKQVYYLRLVFDPNVGFGTANQWSITMWSGLTPGEQFESVFIHELGHVVGFNLFNPQDASEGWAEDFRGWVQNGCAVDSHVYRSIKAGKRVA